MSDTNENTNEYRYKDIGDYVNYQPEELRKLSVISVNDQVHEWIKKLNSIIVLSNVVMNNSEHPNDDSPFYKFGYMSANDKVYLDSLHSKIKAETNGLNIVSSLIDTTNLTVKKVNKIIDTYEVNDEPSNVEYVTNISINHDSIDVQKIMTKGTLTINMNGGTGTDIGGRSLYSEKILSIYAQENTIIYYSTLTGNNSSNENSYRFVNNGIHPNLYIQYDNSTGQYKKSTFLTTGNILVLKIILIGDDILISIIDNTQLVENYTNEDYHE